MVAVNKVTKIYLSTITNMAENILKQLLTHKTRQSRTLNGTHELCNMSNR